MIYTVTLNPALDYLAYLDGFTLSKVNRTVKEEVYCGGKGINVSIMLSRFGIDNAALGFTAGFTGMVLEAWLNGAGIRTDFVRLPKGMTRINVKIRAAEETEINGRGPDISREALEMLTEKLNRVSKGDTIVLAGSIPASAPDDVYEGIMRALDGKGVHFAVDAEGRPLLSALQYRPFLIKPNHIELGELFGRSLDSREHIIECGRALQEKGARNVLVSMAGSGAILLCEGGRTYELGAPAGTVKNSVGAGDSMVAGFLAGYQLTGDYYQALRYGTAAGSATAFSQGLAQWDAINDILESI